MKMNGSGWIGLAAGSVTAMGAMVLAALGIHGHLWSWFALAIWVGCTALAFVWVEATIKRIDRLGVEHGTPTTGAE